MSKGIGKVQRDILRVLVTYGPYGKPAGYLHTHLVCFLVWMPAEGKASEPTEAQARSYRRALALLVKAGLVKRARKKDMVRNDLLKITDGGLAFGGWLLDPPRPTEEEHSRAMQEFGRVESRRAMVRTFAISAAGSKTANERLDRLLARMKTEGTE